MIDRVVQYEICQPESEQRNPRLHENAFKNVLVHVMAEFMGQHRFDLFRGVIVEESVGQNDAARAAQAGERRVGLLAFFRELPALHAAHARARSLAQLYQTAAEVLILQRFELIENRQQQHRRKLRHQDE